MSIEATIARFIADELLFGGGPTKIDTDTLLLTSGILDSLGFMRLMIFLEEELGVKVGDDEVIPENFETINRIKAFVESRRAL